MVVSFLHTYDGGFAVVCNSIFHSKDRAESGRRSQDCSEVKVSSGTVARSTHMTERKGRYMLEARVSVCEFVWSMVEKIINTLF